MPVEVSDIRLYKAGTGLGGPPGAEVACGTVGDFWPSYTDGSTPPPPLFSYRCLYVANTSSQTALDCRVYLTLPPPPNNVDFINLMGADPNPASAAGASVTVASETTAPPGVALSYPPYADPTGLAIGDLPAGHRRAVWFRRTTGIGGSPTLLTGPSVCVGFTTEGP